MRNYDSSQVGVPYIRVPLLQIEYPQPLHASVRISEVEAVQLADGSIRHLNELGEISFTVLPSGMADVLQLVDPTTGADIPGATMTVQSLMLGILAMVRREQKKQL